MYLPSSLRALKVIALTPHIRAYLESHDPQALAQVERAIKHHEGVYAKAVASGKAYADNLPEATK